MIEKFMNWIFAKAGVKDVYDAILFMCFGLIPLLVVVLAGSALLLWRAFK